MKKEIREVDKKRNIVRVTTADERWYLKPMQTKTGLPEYKPYPSVTWICDSYPKGVEFYKWLASKGWDESQTIKNDAGHRGSKVHNAISAIIRGEEVLIDSSFPDSNGNESELTVEEIEAIMSFVAWQDEIKPEWVGADLTVYSDKHEYAGSLDAIAKIDDKLVLIDFKTSQSVWPSYKAQLSAYREAIVNGENPVDGVDGDLSLAILQVGYRLNKKGFKYTETENDFALFQALQTIWRNERSKEKSLKGFSQKDYPMVLFAPAQEEETTNEN